MNLESPKVKVEKSQQDLFDFLSDVKNFESLMPEILISLKYWLRINSCLP